jgi:hypothetical protein
MPILYDNNNPGAVAEILVQASLAREFIRLDARYSRTKGGTLDPTKSGLNRVVLGDAVSGSGSGP